MQSGGVSYDMTRPYSIFQQLFRTLCSISDRDSPEEARKRIENLCEDFQPEVEQDAARAAELILTFHQEPSSPGAEGETLKRELFSRMVTAWRKPAELPLVMVFDDLHWADPASVELLQHLFQLCDDIPILFLCAMRPYRQSAGWAIKQYAESNYNHRLSMVSLEPLSDGESGDLINGLLTISELPAELSQLIRGKAEGNPFFVEELIRTLIDQGAITHDESGAHWRATGELEQISVPDTLQALLVSRIDRLDKEVRRTVQLSSVIGRAFYFRVLEWIAEAGERVRDHLNVLQRVDLILEHARLPELEYVFRHDLTRDAAYESILRKERPEFHRQVGEAIEALFPERLEEESHRLAYHYREAKDDEKALKYYTLAGNLARRLSAYSEAISHYSQALDLANRSEASPAQLSFLYTRRGRMYELAGRYDEALANYREMQELGGKLAEPGLELSALNAQATIHAIPSGKWDPVQAEALATAALALSQKLSDPRGEAKALWNLMLVENFAERDNEAAIRHGERSLAIARQHGLTEETAYALHDLARSYSMRGDFSAAARANEEARALWEQLGNSELLADNLTSSGFTLMLQGNLAQAVALSTRALELGRQTGNAWGQAYCLMSLGAIHVERGEISDGIRDFRQSTELAREANFAPAQMFAGSYTALTYLRLGNEAGALPLLEEAMRATSEHDPTRFLPALAMAVLLASRGEAAEAQRLALQVTTTTEGRAVNPEFLGFYAYLETEYLMASQQFDRVLEVVTDRLEHLERYNARYFFPLLILNRARGLRGLGRQPEAQAPLEQARGLAEEIGLKLILLSILLETAELATELGEQQKAESSRQAAKATIQFISQHIEDPVLLESFRTLPRIQSILSA